VTAKKAIQLKARIGKKVSVWNTLMLRVPTVLTMGTNPRNAKRSRFLRFRYSFHCCSKPLIVRAE
jgi:hypothetical protein